MAADYHPLAPPLRARDDRHRLDHLPDHAGGGFIASSQVGIDDLIEVAQIPQVGIHCGRSKVMMFPFASIFSSAPTQLCADEGSASAAPLRFR